MTFHFVKLRKIWYLISLAIIIPGLISLMLQGLSLGIDFTGGSLIEVRFQENVNINQVRGVVTEQGYKDAVIQKGDNKDYIIRTSELTEEESENILTALNENAGSMELLRNQRVSPIISNELIYSALWALLLASALILTYISIRFEFKQGIAAIIAILHDVFIVLSIFSLLQITVNSAFVAAMLTIIGYSINDTIIIFDRVRENLRTRKRKESLEDLVNASLWQTLARSINTVLTVMFVLVALFLFGGSTIQNFVLAMLIGVVSGAYSSIFTASPVWVDFKLREKKVS
ncbi:MAG: protein translocase subunit SecF [Clostridiales bacterium]|nr:protein translocase subunit SecF [Clostridiales bacterium]MCF8022120.1 protein translocase subunit SecF [Clostridiales bacterium]